MFVSWYDEVTIYPTFCFLCFAEVLAVFPLGMPIHYDNDCRSAEYLIL